ncbi:MAG: hypothetical protein IH986_15415 [Planctomycetes bacterium]|nr:hypothetical protein [Planctomycetota bacterium]
MSARNPIIAGSLFGVLCAGAFALNARAADLWQITTVDASGDVGEYSSIAALPAGGVGISYFDLRNSVLKYAWQDSRGWNTIVVDSSGSVGEHTSLAVLPNGQPAISYYAGGQRVLKYAWFDPAGGWSDTIVDGIGGDAGAIGTSLAILGSGDPAISYRDHWNGTLKYARLDAGRWRTTLVDGTANVGHNSSLAIQQSGQPAISYVDFTNDRLKYAWSDGLNWQHTDVSAPGGTNTSLVILPSGNPAIVHDAGGGLNYVTFDGKQWSSMRVDSVSGRESWFGYASLRLQPSGKPAMCYVKRVFPLPADQMYAWFDGGRWKTQRVGRAGGGESSLTFLPSGQPAISYRDANSLMFATRRSPGDLNCDGRFDGADIDPFFLALGDPAAYAAQFPNCDPLLGDMNRDGRLDGGDIDPFFACLGGGPCP